MFAPPARSRARRAGWRASGRRAVCAGPQRAPYARAAASPALRMASPPPPGARRDRPRDHLSRSLPTAGRRAAASHPGTIDAKIGCVWRRVNLSIVVLLTLAGCGGKTADPTASTSPENTKQAKTQAHSSGKVRAQMKGVDLVIDPSVVLEVRSLRGELVPTREGEPPWFDEPGSFTVKIDSGEVAMTPASMSAVMNKYVFSYPGAPVKDIEIKIEGDHLKQTATIKKKIDLKTTIEGKLSVTPEGDIRLHPDKIKAEGLSVKGLLDLFDVELDEMIKTRESRGVRIEKNDFILDPERLLPPPKITGRVTAVR